MLMLDTAHVKHLIRQLNQRCFSKIAYLELRIETVICSVRVCSVLMIVPKFYMKSGDRK